MSSHINKPFTASAMATLVLVTLCLGCRAPVENEPVAPRWAAASAHGVVRAESPATAQEVASAWDRIVPFVVSTIPGVTNRPVSIWVVDGPSEASSDRLHEGGFTVPSKDHITLFEDGGSASAPVLVHEAVHHLINSTWDALPPAVEEGLASWVAAQWDEQTRVRVRAEIAELIATHLGGTRIRFRMGPTLAVALDQIRGSVAGPIGLPIPLKAILDLDDVDFAALPPGDRLIGQVVGTLVFMRIQERVGMGGLYEACRAVPGESGPLLPTDWLVAAADLEDADCNWEAILGSFLGEQEVRYFAVGVAPREAAKLADLARRWEPALEGRSAVEVLDSYPFAVQVRDSLTWVRLNQDPGFREAFQAAWDAPR